MMENKEFEKILFTKDELIKRIEELASEINSYYKDYNDVLVVPVLDGSIVFAGHLLINLDFDLAVRGTKISSYQNNTKSNNNPELKIAIDMSEVKDKDILIIEDLIDTGNTLSMFKDYLLSKGAKSVKICVLFNKQIKDQSKRKVNIDWTGFNIGDEWVAGFGIDSKSKLRNKPFFGVVKK